MMALWLETLDRMVDSGQRKTQQSAESTLEGDGSSFLLLSHLLITMEINATGQP